MFQYLGRFQFLEPILVPESGTNIGSRFWNQYWFQKVEPFRILEHDQNCGYGHNQRQTLGKTILFSTFSTWQSGSRFWNLHCRFQNLEPTLVPESGTRISTKNPEPTKVGSRFWNQLSVWNFRPLTVRCWFQKLEPKLQCEKGVSTRGIRSLGPGPPKPGCTPCLGGPSP